MLPKVKRLRDRLISFCKIVGIDLVVTSEFRSSAEQDKLYAQGRATPGNIVTNARGGESMHNYGIAFDVAINRNGKYDYNITPFIGWLGEFIGLEWGGRWSNFKDVNHFQYTCGYTLGQLKNGDIDLTKFL